MNIISWLFYVLSVQVQELFRTHSDAFDLLAELVQLVFQQADADGTATAIGQDMAACLVQQLLPAMGAAPPPDRAAALLRTLHMLATVRPDLLRPHAIVLQPFVKKPASPQETPLLIAALGVFRGLFPLLSIGSTTVLSERALALLQYDLQAIIFAANAPVMREAIPCLCALVTHAIGSLDVIQEVCIVTNLCACVSFVHARLCVLCVSCCGSDVVPFCEFPGWVSARCIRDQRSASAALFAGPGAALQAHGFGCPPHNTAAGFGQHA